MPDELIMVRFGCGGGVGGGVEGGTRSHIHLHYVMSRVGTNDVMSLMLLTESPGRDGTRPVSPS